MVQLKGPLVFLFRSTPIPFEKGLNFRERSVGLAPRLVELRCPGGRRLRLHHGVKRWQKAIRTQQKVGISASPLYVSEYDASCSTACSK